MVKYGIVFLIGCDSEFLSIHNVNIGFREADAIKNWLLQSIKNAMPYFSYAIFSQFFLAVYFTVNCNHFIRNKHGIIVINFM